MLNSIATYLIDAQDTRNRGDYNIDPGLTAEQAAAQIVLAEQFLELAAQLIGILPEAAIATLIQNPCKNRNKRNYYQTSRL